MLMRLGLFDEYDHRPPIRLRASEQLDRSARLVK
jgi:hypothetical protein